MNRTVRSITCSLLVFIVAAFARAAELPVVKPEEAGMSSAKLGEIDPAVKKLIDDGRIAGAVTIVARRGNVVHFKSHGLSDVSTRRSMTDDTIFRIYSMSKPITSVAVMMLAEDGRLKLDDPVGKHLPDLASIKVFGGGDDVEKDLVEPKRPMTIRDLLRHTSGLTYGFFGNSPVDKLYGQRGVLDRNTTLADMVGKLGEIPLCYQPGTKFNYSVSTDVLGRLVEVVSKKPLDEFFAERIFKPLDMKDTGFFVRQSSSGRLAATHGRREGKLLVSDAPKKSRYLAKPKLLSGGGGLVSTGRDYLRFCQMLANGGRLHDVRILKRKTVAMMTANQLPAAAMPIGVGAGDRRDGKGFGLGFSVRVAKSNKRPAEVVGEYGWGGAASTHFWISPKHELVAITLRQFMPYQGTLELKLKPIIYDAIVDRAK